jgi:hypothetical protein
MAVLVGAAITLAIGAAAQAAMVADFRSAAQRAELRQSTLHQVLDPVWYGGELAPIKVEVAPAEARPATAARRAPRPRPRPAPPVTSAGDAVRIG